MDDDIFMLPGDQLFIFGDGDVDLTPIHGGVILTLDSSEGEWSAIIHGVDLSPDPWGNWLFWG